MISSVYSYYLSQYGNKSNSKYDSHTRTQLKNTYSKVVKINSQTPVYKLDLSTAAQKYAIDLKEHARALENITEDLSDGADGTVCSNPRNLRIERFTEAWKRIPPLYGPMALLNCTR